MKQASKNEIDMLDLMNKIQAQLIALDKKVDSLVNRSLPEVKPVLVSSVNTTRPLINPNDHNKSRMKYTAVCADCKKDCTIPFKPTGDRPVYCQDCFSRRKVISISRIGIDNKPKEILPIVQTVVNKEVEMQQPEPKKRKKTVAVKKPVAKKKVTPKKK